MKNIKRIRVVDDRIHFEFEKMNSDQKEIHLVFKENDIIVFEHIFKSIGNQSLEIPSNLEGKRVRIIEINEELEIFYQSLFLPFRPRLFSVEVNKRISIELESTIKMILAKGTI